MAVCSQSCQYEFQSLEQVMACSVPWHKSCLTCASCKKVRSANALNASALVSRRLQSLDSTNLCDKTLENGKQVL
jgi:hypothetical protein